MKLKNSFAYLSGIPGVTENDVFELAIESQVMTLNRYEKHGKQWRVLQCYQIPLCNILEVQWTGKGEVVRRDRSVIGGGLLGGFLGGSDGMTLGALNALKTEETFRRVFLTITYLSESDPEELKNIVFEASGRIADIKYIWQNNNFFSKLQEIISKTQPSPIVSAMREKARQLSVPNPGGVVTL